MTESALTRREEMARVITGRVADPNELTDEDVELLCLASSAMQWSEEMRAELRGAILALANAWWERVEIDQFALRRRNSR
jgi:hypothetical protein